MNRIAVMVSGRGSNLQALIDACKNNVLDAEICLVLSDNEHSVALDRASVAGIPAISVEHDDHERILQFLVGSGASLIVLAGYTQKIDDMIINEFPNAIINIHPSILPKYGGKGMYGLAVHREVLASGDDKTGVTIHYVNGEYDEGAIINQLVVSVLEHKTPEALAAHIMPYEKIILVHTVKWLIENN